MGESTDPVWDAWDTPLTGREVGAWMLDVIEQMVTDPTDEGEPSPRSRQALDRILDAGEPEVSIELALRCAVILANEYRWHYAVGHRPDAADIDEIDRRVFRDTRKALRGEETNPFLASDQDSGE